MRIAVLDETKAGEPRVAVTPDTIGKLKASARKSRSRKVPFRR